MKNIMLTEKERFIRKIYPQIEKYLQDHSTANYGPIQNDWWGPYIWGEADLRKVINTFCIEEFGLNCVHNESKVNHSWFKDFKELLKGKKLSEKMYIDIDITDATMVTNREELRLLTHGLFIELKFFGNNVQGQGLEKTKSFMNAIKKDCIKLTECLENNVCKEALLLIDDDGKKDGSFYISEEFINQLSKDFKEVSILLWHKKDNR